VMIERIRSVGAELEEIAHELDATTCSGREAVDLVEALGVIRRLADGMVARAAKRVEDTAAYAYRGERNAAEVVERLVGISTGEAKRAIEVADKLDRLPATDEALRSGRLSARQADLIVAAAGDQPEIEADLLRAAAQGVVPLRDAAVAARAAREDQGGTGGSPAQGPDVPDVDRDRRHGRRPLQGHARGRRCDEGPHRRPDPQALSGRPVVRRA
jgi:hypothetical protein